VKDPHQRESRLKLADERRHLSGIVELAFLLEILTANPQRVDRERPIG